MTSSPKNMDTYRIVYDSKQVEETARLFLSSQSPCEGWIKPIVFISRNKYHPEPIDALSARGSVKLGDFVIDLDRDKSHSAGQRLLSGLEALEKPIGGLYYHHRCNDHGSGRGRVPVQQGTTVALLGLDPRNQKYDHKESTFVDLDIDTKDKLILDTLARGLRHCFSVDRVNDSRAVAAMAAIIETRGGYHVPIRLDLLTAKQREWIFDTDHGEFVSVNVNAMIPIPGTIQGGFGVKFVDKFEI